MAVYTQEKTPACPLGTTPIVVSSVMAAGALNMRVPIPFKGKLVAARAVLLVVLPTSDMVITLQKTAAAGTTMATGTITQSGCAVGDLATFTLTESACYIENDYININSAGTNASGQTMVYMIFEPYA